MEVGFYGHVRQYHNLKEEIDAAILQVLESGKCVMGPTLARFEKELADYFKMKHAIGCNSGTDALWLAFLALGIGPGDEVITVANTFFATAEAIWFVGAKPVFVEIEPDTCNQIADWLDDPDQVHPCNGESAFEGLQIMMAICRSVVQRGKVFLPLGPGEPELEALKNALP